MDIDELYYNLNHSDYNRIELINKQFKEILDYYESLAIVDKMVETEEKVRVDCYTPKQWEITLFKDKFYIILRNIYDRLEIKIVGLLEFEYRSMLLNHIRQEGMTIENFVKNQILRLYHSPIKIKLLDVDLKQDVNFYNLKQIVQYRINFEIADLYLMTKENMQMLEEQSYTIVNITNKIMNYVCDELKNKRTENFLWL